MTVCVFGRLPKFSGLGYTLAMFCRPRHMIVSATVNFTVIVIVIVTISIVIVIVVVIIIVIVTISIVWPLSQLREGAMLCLP